MAVQAAQGGQAPAPVQPAAGGAEEAPQAATPTPRVWTCKVQAKARRLEAQPGADMADVSEAESSDPEEGLATDPMQEPQVQRILAEATEAAATPIVVEDTAE